MWQKSILCSKLYLSRMFKLCLEMYEPEMYHSLIVKGYLITIT
jgi:hypothetical protein